MTYKSYCLTPLLLGIALLGCSDPDPTPPAAVGPLGDRADLPVDGRIRIDGLSAPVDIVRDDQGRPHIYASTLADAMRAEGYMVAIDRTVQIDLFRRHALGTTAKYFATVNPAAINQDIGLRTVGVNRIAAAQYASIQDPQAKALLEAYADGITQAFRRMRSGEIPLPPGITNYPLEALVDWTAIDSLAVARLRIYQLSNQGTAETFYTNLFADLGKTFPTGSPDPSIAKRAGMIQDLWLLAPRERVYTSSSTPQSPNPKPGPPKPPPTARERLPASSDAFFRILTEFNERLSPDGFGSNTWAIAPSRSATGHVLLASDPHLGLGAPSTFWPVALHVGATGEGLHVSGVAFPGVPGITLGHNEHIGWGSAVAGYDVTDVYTEELTPDGKAVMWKGAPVPLEFVEEVIEVQGGDPIVYKLPIVPHHGPIAPTIENGKILPIDPAAGAVSVRWTGHAATHDLEALFTLMLAKSVDEARTSLEQFEVGAQSWVVGDTTGNILWTSHARVPKRAPGALTWDPMTGAGNLPCLALPGDGTAEWEDDIPGAMMPWGKNPENGYIIAANNDSWGGTDDGDPTNDKFSDGTPAYLGCEFDIGFRASRIKTLLEGAKAPITPEDMATYQGDARSNLGARLAPFLIEAITRGEAERATPGTHPDLTAVVADPAFAPDRVTAIKAALQQWGTEADYLAAAGIDEDTGEILSDAEGAPKAVEARAARATLIFNVWLIRLLRRTFGDEYVRAGREEGIPRAMQLDGILHLVEDDHASFATLDPATSDSALWDDIDTPAVESRHERALRSLLDAIAWLDKNATESKAVWGAHHKVTFAPLTPMWVEMHIPSAYDPVFKTGFPRHGDLLAVDASDFTTSWALDASPNFTYAVGAAQRFVLDLDPAGPRSWNAIPGGNVWDPASPHFRDGADLWRKNQTRAVPFRVEDVVAAKESRHVLSTQ
ncbi:penicillin acylase family protein [Polyangium sp. 6x1]|uniref:penicillin acylase family protein n=1 Tax=Polyangium sp. 6x1 TaxID=3042689 RepID=UPI00248233FE|nr:penicillin acylase family protein [Polyangium sp. 6x1]MDI1443040.1 penicillin acylase family protein [Polyangium sp. 6x1]